MATQDMQDQRSSRKCKDSEQESCLSVVSAIDEQANTCICDTECTADTCSRKLRINKISTASEVDRLAFYLLACMHACHSIHIAYVCY